MPSQPPPEAIDSEPEDSRLRELTERCVLALEVGDEAEARRILAANEDLAPSIRGHLAALDRLGFLSDDGLGDLPAILFRDRFAPGHRQALVRIDGDVSPDEALMAAEIGGMIDAYLGGGEAPWAVVLVPQSDLQDEAIRSLAPGIEPTSMRGGRAYLVGRHHSRDYADVVGRRYESLEIFSAVLPVEA